MLKSLLQTSPVVMLVAACLWAIPVGAHPAPFSSLDLRVQRQTIDAIKNVDTVIGGHANTTMIWDDLREFAQFNDDFLARAQAAITSGKPLDQAATEWKVPDKYVGYSTQAPSLFGGMAGRLQVLSDEMNGK